ncbi:amino acid permease-associated region [Sulfobacillus acidophilus TPY]|nr:amino acid permease-associated region [Sulfobacillus acidophilus TPY]
MFVRNATGLVRELSPFDAFNLVFSAVLIPVGISEALGFSPAVFTGANVAISFVIAAVLMVAFGAVYLYFTNLMPRSGGDYVWVSRTLSPGVGFVTNAALTFVFLTWVSFNFTTMISYFGPAVFYLWGLPNGLITTLSQPGWEFAIATGLTMLFTALMITGIRRVARYMRWMFWLVWVGMGIWLVGMAVTPSSVFQARLKAVTGHSAASVISLAHHYGASFSSGVNWGMTLLAMVYAFQVYTGFQWTGYFAGEVKNVRKTAVTSIMGGLLVAAILYTGGTVLVYHSTGYTLYNALAYLGFNDASKLPANVPYVLPALARFLSLPAILRDYIGLSFILAIFWWTPTGFMLGTRNLFAWAFDRLMPESLAEVSERFHTPVKATLVIGAVVEVINVANVYLGLSEFLINIIAVMAAAFIVVSISAIVFPYRRRDLFEEASPMVQRRLAGVPLLTWAGLIGTAIWVAVLIIALTTPYFGLSTKPIPMLEAFIVPIAAIIYYLVVSAVRKREGFDLNVSFKAIPPE